MLAGRLDTSSIFMPITTEAFSMGQVAASFKGLAAVTYRGAVIITLGLNRLHLCVGISVNRYLASLGIYFPEIPPPRCLTYI